MTKPAKKTILIVASLSVLSLSGCSSALFSSYSDALALVKGIGSFVYRYYVPNKYKPDSPGTIYVGDLQFDAQQDGTWRAAYDVISGNPPDPLIVALAGADPAPKAAIVNRMKDKKLAVYGRIRKVSRTGTVTSILLGTDSAVYYSPLVCDFLNSPKLATPELGPGETVSIVGNLIQTAQDTRLSNCYMPEYP